ncbi:hypothetical protein [Polluticoccus soli]|uniref:hypothetical protein n=1 Tax=Polluticoccus soli TaxID=3034150 RepID=UPI0023E0F4D9|nr:hypothetical protein [Flavipsychrobacter sp. JY13-12]
MTRVLSLIVLSVFFVLNSYAQKAEAIKIKDETYYGVRSIPGYTVTGTYKYEGKGEPIIQLNPDGTGLFQRHGVPADKIKWWIMAESNGTVKTNKGEYGQQHTLITELQEDIYQTVSGGRQVKAWSAGDFDMHMVTIKYDENKIYILGERVKDAK